MSGRNWADAAAQDSGQAMVELALVFLVFATLVFGGLEFTRALTAWTVVTAASREGARTAAVSCSMSAACATNVDARVAGALTGLDVAMADWSMDPAPYVSGNPITVHVQYTLTPVVPLIAVLIPGGVFTINADATMRLE